MGFIRSMAGDALDQLIVGDRVSVAEHHGSDLRIENRMRDNAGLMPDDLDVLPSSVEHLQHALVGHQLEKRLQIDGVR